MFRSFLLIIFITIYCIPGILFVEKVRHKQGYLTGAQVVCIPVVLVGGPLFYLISLETEGKWFKVKNKE